MIAPCVVKVVLHSPASLATHATVFLEHLEDCCKLLVFFLSLPQEKRVMRRMRRPVDLKRVTCHYLRRPSDAWVAPGITSEAGPVIFRLEMI